MSDVLAPPRRRAPTVRAASIEPRFGQVMCPSSAGFHAMSYTEWGDPDAERVAICVHGLTRQGRDFDPLAVGLVQRGYRVLCPDLAGRGLSEWLADPADYTLPQYASDIIMLLARCGAAQVDWIGTSLGGLLGMHLAAMEGSPIRRMVINDVGPFLPGDVLARFGAYLNHMPKSFANFHAAEAYFREILAPYGRLGDAEWFHMTKYSIARNEDGRFRLLIDPELGRPFRSMLSFSVSMWRQWDAMTCPVLVLRGEHSDLLTRDVAYAMTQRGPRAKVVEFPDVGHAPALMDHRQVGTIGHWLTSG